VRDAATAFVRISMMCSWPTKSLYTLLISLPFCRLISITDYSFGNSNLLQRS
jgi:hypothetical protein